MQGAGAGDWRKGSADIKLLLKNLYSQSPMPHTDVTFKVILIIIFVITISITIIVTFKVLNIIVVVITTIFLQLLLKTFTTFHDNYIPVQQWRENQCAQADPDSLQSGF